MKFQSILINTNIDLSVQELNEFLSNKNGLTEAINDKNSFSVSLTKNSIGIGELEEISEWINLKSFKIKYVIINNAESLTTEAQNSLLKNLEEPPDNTQFVLLTKNTSKILETILSRSLMLFIQKENINYAQHKDLALKFITASYIEKTKMTESIIKEYEKREEVAEIVFEIMKNLPADKNKAEKVKLVKNIYVGIKSSVNLKLCLDLLAISI